MLGVFFIIAACALWAIDTLIRYPLIFGGIPASTIVFTEHLILVILFSPLLFKMRKKWTGIRVADLGCFLFIGGIGSALASVAFTKAFSLINPSLVILLQKLQPIVAIVLARIVLQEKLKREYFFWALLCLLGGALISYKDIVPGLQSINWDSGLFSQKYLMGYGLTLLAVVGWGASTVFGKKLSENNYSEWEIMGGRFLFGLIFLLPYLAGETLPLPTSEAVWGKIALMVILSGILGMYFYYSGLKKLSARLCALAEMFFPFCAIAVNWVYLDASLTAMQLVGGGLLMVGSTVIQLKRY